MKKTNVITKNSELTRVLNTHLQGKINLARLKLISHFVIALCKVQTVTFEKLANAFDTESACESSLRRIQRFIANYSLDANLVARLVFNLLPKQGKLILSIDRTNWKFGQTNINIFMLDIVYKAVALRCYLLCLIKRETPIVNEERIDLINRFSCLFGKQVIESVVVDREFVGEQCLEFLNRENIRYYIRIRNNFKVFLTHKDKIIKASHLFTRFKTNGQLCYLSEENKIF